MMLLLTAPGIIVTAVLLDLAVGDPPWLCHPVKTIGWLVNRGESVFRRLFLDPFIAGALLTLTVLFITVSLALALTVLAYSLSIWTGHITQIILIAAALALKSLTGEGSAARRLIRQADLAPARRRVQELVSRDMSREDARGVIRATLESLSENLSDGVIAPLFFAILLGAPGVWGYKAVNTLDSMIGYRNKKYREFGKFAARLDDVINFLPARLTGLLIVLSAGVLGHSFTGSIRAWIKDAPKGPSPNGGIPIAAFAGALNLRLGGDCYSPEGVLLKIPMVGGQRTRLTGEDIGQLNLYIFAAVALLLLFYALLDFIL